uniref:Uncharacterized protein n=1 Tax=Candidatus Kentrum sp. FW TaxID=2126338 RepID=A0A450TBA4_9GAMM|nr:MAG: hypothetical protein BECKFW1821A_GA0114235_11622 [Candidatus Kentron sp. FW]
MTKHSRGRLVSIVEEELHISPAFIAEHDRKPGKYWRYEGLTGGVLCRDVATQRCYKENI